MSYEGKLLRGLKWHEQRDKNGNYPDGIKNTEKMIDLESYLEFSKEKSEKKIKVLLMKLSEMARTRKKNLPQYSKLLNELKNLGTNQNKSKVKK